MLIKEAARAVPYRPSTIRLAYFLQGWQMVCQTTEYTGGLTDEVMDVAERDRTATIQGAGPAKVRSLLISPS